MRNEYERVFFFFFFLSLFIKFEAESRPPSSLQMHGNAAILSRPSSFLQLFPLPFLSFPPFSNLPVFFFFFFFSPQEGKNFSTKQNIYSWKRISRAYRNCNDSRNDFPKISRSNKSFPLKATINEKMYNLNANYSIRILKYSIVKNIYEVSSRN